MNLQEALEWADGYVSKDKERKAEVGTLAAAVRELEAENAALRRVVDAARLVAEYHENPLLFQRMCKNIAALDAGKENTP